jgi:hypothetical protein
VKIYLTKSDSESDAISRSSGESSCEEGFFQEHFFSLYFKGVEEVFFSQACAAKIDKELNKTLF